MKGKMYIFFMLFFMSVSVCSAEEPETVSQELDEVVVTASRVKEKVKETPVTINIVTNNVITSYSIHYTKLYDLI